MFFKNIESITENDLNDLVEKEVFEKRTLEYKECFPGNSVSDKKELLADVSSFANSAGGYMIFGIREKKGVPQEVKGFENNIIDQEKTRLENMIINGISPRITGINFRSIKVKNNKYVLIIKIPRSFAGPHRVIYNHHDKFYTRDNACKHQMDISELRNAFNKTEENINKIKEFRENRISKIYANQTPVPFSYNAKLVLHLIPFVSVFSGQRYSLNSLNNVYDKLEPISKGNIYSNSYNSDGLVTYSKGGENKYHSYVQLFNNGIIEALEGKYLDPMNYEGELIIRATPYENRIIEVLKKYILTLKELNIELPITIAITFVGVRGYKISQKEGKYSLEEKKPIDKDILYLPEVTIERYNVSVPNILKAPFDILWNASGVPGSPNYNEEGKRI